MTKTANPYPGYRVETWRGGQTGRMVVKVWPLAGGIAVVGYATLDPDRAIRECIEVIESR